ncbi:MAG: hypothetical protein BWZ09_02578 [Alphaproteobacteria bacterium ADurb.BinA305]|nr:MAG: hypothetical protein BWZ09_02578 [Alphaproteobacteria bacterium ADurb.BinA305]
MQELKLVPGVAQRLGDGPDDGEGFALRQGPVALEAPVERLALDAGHGQVVVTAVLAGLVDGHDVGVVQTGRQSAFVQEALHRLVVGSEARRQDLHRDLAVHRELRREEDLAHAALAKAAVETEAAQGSAAVDA